MTRALPAELALAAACCQWPLSPEGEERIQAAAARVNNWPLFEEVASRNRIRPLVFHGLRQAAVEVPEPFRKKFAYQALEKRRRALSLERESLQLQQAFDARGLPITIIKGVPLAILAYGDIGMKEAVDVDLLTTPETAAEGRELLIELGYRTKIDKLGPREISSYARHINQAAFANPQTGMNVDLHWKLVPHRRVFRGLEAPLPTRQVSTPGGTLRTLADEPLFAYLCVHGSLHNWSRLKWLADVGALLAARSETQVERLYQAAVDCGAGRCAAVALLLGRRLFSVDLNEDLAKALERDFIARALANNVIAGLAYRSGTANPDPFTVPWLRLILAQFLLSSGPRHAVDQVRVFWNSPTDRAVYLPRGFEFAYHLLRLPRWFGRAGARALIRKRT